MSDREIDTVGEAKNSVEGDGDYVRVRTEQRSVVHSSYEGPMPTPEMLARYDTVCPGTAEKIVFEFQANAAHMRQSERDALAAAISNERSNRSIASKLVWGAFVLILVTALTGHDSVAIAVAVSTIVAVIGGFIGGKKTPAMGAGDRDGDT